MRCDEAREGIPHLPIAGFWMYGEDLVGRHSLERRRVSGGVFERLLGLRALFALPGLPLETVVVFQPMVQGLAVISAPRLAPSSLNCTPTTPTLSDADADTVSLVPETVAPLAGAVIDTVGGVMSLVNSSAPMS